MAKTHYTAQQRKKFSLQSAKAKLRFSNFLIGVLCVVALVFLYIQPFFSVQVSYAVSAETLQQILQEQMGTTEISKEDLEDVDLTLGFSMTLEGKGLTGLLGDELNALLRMGNGGTDGQDDSSGSGENAPAQDEENTDTATAFAAAADNSAAADDSAADGAQEPTDDSSPSSSQESAEDIPFIGSLLQACKDNEVVQDTISASVDELIVQAQAAVPRVVAIYVSVVVSEQVNGQGNDGEQTDTPADSSGGEEAGQAPQPGTDAALAAAMTARRPYAKYLAQQDVSASAADLDIDELTAAIESLLSKDSVTVEEAKNAVMDYVEKNRESLGLTEESVAEVESQVGEALGNMAQQFGEPVTDENGAPVLGDDGTPVMAIRPEEVFTDILVQAGMVDEEKVNEGAELSELLTDYIMTQMGETEDALYYVFMAFSLILAILYVLWGFLLIKSIVKTCTGTPMGAFFVKLLTGLPFLILVIVPTVGLSVLGMEGILNLLSSAGLGNMTSELSGLTLGVSGGWVAFVCTVVLFVFGFLYSAFKREYRHAEKDLG